MTAPVQRQRQLPAEVLGEPGRNLLIQASFFKLQILRRYLRNHATKFRQFLLAWIFQMRLTVLFRSAVAIHGFSTANQLILPVVILGWANALAPA